MRLLRRFSPLVRAMLIIGVVVVLAGGVAYAAFSGQAALSDNQISTAHAKLLLWDGDTFEKTAPGFHIANLVPGVGSERQYFYLRNDGDVPLRLRAYVPSPPVEPDTGFGFSGWEHLSVTFYSLKEGCESSQLTTTMQSLMDQEVPLPCGELAPGAEGNPGTKNTEGAYAVVFDIDPEAITEEHAGVGSFDLVFGGYSEEGE